MTKNNGEASALPGLEGSGSVFDIPPFLRRESQDAMETETQVLEPEAPPAEPMAEEGPSLQEVITTIQKLTAKRDTLNETIRILKKQAEGMLKKL